MRFKKLNLYSCVFVIVVLGMASVSFAEQTKTQTSTCFGTEQQTRLHLQRLRDALECSGHQNLGDCRNRIAIAGSLAALGGATGAAASLRASKITDFCKIEHAGLFMSEAYAANVQCKLDTMRLRDEMRSDLKNLNEKLNLRINETQSELAAIGDSFHRQSSEGEFLRSISNRSPDLQARLIQDKLNELPDLRKYADKLDEVMRLQSQRNLFIIGDAKLNSALINSPSQLTAILDETFATKLVSKTEMGEGVLNAGREASLFNEAAKAVLAEDASRFARTGATALARLFSFRMMGVSAARIGLGIAAIGASEGVFAATYSAPLGCKDEFASQNKYAVFNDKNKCEISPAIGPNTIQYLYELPWADQIRVLNDKSGFCAALQSLESTQGPETWKAQCTSGGFKLTSKANSESKATTLAFDTDKNGGLSRMRFLGPDKSGPTGGRADQLGISNMDYETNHFAVIFDANETPAKIQTLASSGVAGRNPDDLSFSDPHQYRESAAADVLNGSWFKKDPKIAANMQIYEGAQLAISEVQMCCTPTMTEGTDLDSRCALWNVNRAQGPSSLSPNRDTK